MFKEAFLRDQVDSRINERWKRRWGQSAPFGNLRRIFRNMHCATINPYDSRYCPYSKRDCAIAFYLCAAKTVNEAHDPRSAAGYFRAVARTSALDRAENKPLARGRDDAIPPKGSRDPDAARSGHSAGHGDVIEDGDQDIVAMRRNLARPLHIGDLLRGIDPRSRQGQADDGKEGSI